LNAAVQQPVERLRGNTDEAIAFIKWHFGQTKPLHLVAIWPDSDHIEGKFFGRFDEDALRAWIEQRQGQANLYFTVNRPRPDAPSRKLRKHNIAALIAVCADVDPRPEAESEPGGFRSERARIDGLTRQECSGSSPPSMVLDSGGGHQLFWRFKSEIPLEPEREARTARAENMGRGIARRLGGDSVQNIDRVMRLPGTLNLPDAKKRERGRVLARAAIWTGDGRAKERKDLSYGGVEIEAAYPPVAPSVAAPAAALAVTVNWSTAIAEPSPELRARLAAVLAADPGFAAIWSGDLSALADQTGSGADFKVIGLLRRSGFSPDEAASLWLGWEPGTGSRAARGELPMEKVQYNFERCWPKVDLPADETFEPLPVSAEQEAKDAELKAARAASAEGAVDALNQDHTLVWVGGQSTIARRTRTEDGYPAYRFTAEADLKRWYRNKLVAVVENDKRKMVNPVDRWLGSVRRNEALGATFAPGLPPRVGNHLNLWEGYAVEADETGSCELLKWHLHQIVCNGDVDLYEYLMDWFANMIQCLPKPGVFVVLRGPQGAGKSVIGDYFGKILGAYRVTVSQQKHVTGAFNAHLATCQLLQVEEAFFSGDKQARGIIKDMTTGGTTMMEPKGVDPFQVPNHKRLLIISNERWVVAADMEDRRAFVLDVSAEKRSDLSYHAALRAEMNGKGPARLLWELMRRPVAQKRLERAPLTQGLVDQKLQSLDPLARWWVDVVERGWIDRDILTVRSDKIEPMGEEWPTAFPKVDLWKSYARHADAQGAPGFKAAENKFAQALADHFPGLTLATKKLSWPIGQRRSGFGVGPEQIIRVNCYVLPPLEQCRATVLRSLNGEAARPPDEPRRVAL
jgi:hypothetical protein